MELAVKIERYHRDHGPVKTYEAYLNKFPNGVQICNGTHFSSSKSDFRRFRSHLLRKGKRCKCPNFEDDMEEQSDRVKELEKELRMRKKLNLELDEKRISLEVKLRMIKDAVECESKNTISTIKKILK